MAKSKYHPNSMYRSTKIIGDKYLDIYESEIDYKADYNLQEVIIENKYNQRPDLLAFHLYGDAKFWWIFAEFNQDKLKDPIIDFVAGLTIQVPERFS